MTLKGIKELFINSLCIVPLIDYCCSPYVSLSACLTVCAISFSNMSHRTITALLGKKNTDRHTESYMIHITSSFSNCNGRNEQVHYIFEVFIWFTTRFSDLHIYNKILKLAKAKTFKIMIENDIIKRMWLILKKYPCKRPLNTVSYIWVIYGH